jgi:hypothetical protein|tara:strand:- start:8860 stop:10050 length:1191 start_codon:yes stop_codon:yes gene_type:complete
MRIFATYFLIIFLIINNSFGQKKLIKSIQLLDSKNNNERIIFSSDEKITVVFDELNNKSRSFYYKIEHFNFNWELSKIRKSEYLDGFDNIRITNYYKSYNTLQPYIHYQFQIQNKNLQLKKSGNYKVIVTDREGRNVFSRKFILIKNSLNGTIEISKMRNINFQNSHQKLKVNIPCNNCNFNNNTFQYKLIVFKNYNLNDFRLINRPTFKLSNSFIYDNINFTGGVEYLNFDNSNILSTNIEVSKTYSRDNYITELRIDKVPEIYVYEPDINGTYIIKNNNKNWFTESEYSKVIFSIQAQNINDYPLYIVGSFNNYEKNENSRLKKLKDKYQIELYLKQGFYNYKYLIKKNNMNYDINSFWQTENIYTAILYEKKPEDNYFKIKAIATNNSSNIVN